MGDPQQLSGYRYNYDYRETVRLEDGTDVQLRLLRPEDRDRLRRGFQKLSEETRYRRFLGPKSKLTDRELEYLVDIDQVNHIAIAAESIDANRDPVEAGLARAVRLHDVRSAAEAAVTVADELQALGLGRILLDRLVDASKEREIDTFRATLFAQNQPMQRLLREVGDARIIEREGPVVTLAIALERSDSESEQIDGEERSARKTLERVLSLTGRGAALLVDKFTTDDPEDERSSSAEETPEPPADETPDGV